MPKYTVKVTESRTAEYHFLCDSPAQALTEFTDGLFIDASEYSTMFETAEISEIDGEELETPINFDNAGGPKLPTGNIVKELTEALKTAVSMEYDRDAESRNFEDERLEYWQTLINKAEEL